ncbi:MAG TPA: class I SAM-dependent methyltransferase [Vicinamibacteria bacterium]|nr:class I SAM-dependent methyltransferase [Vicinamibacteria bacterium]
MGSLKRAINKVVDSLIGRLADRIARKAVDYYFHREMHPATLLMREAQTDAAQFVKENMPDALYFLDRELLLRYAIDQIKIPGMILEFGVFSGKSIRLIAERTGRPVHGFDSFEGLPEDWTGNKDPKGAYSTGGKLPEVPQNVTLHKGWFVDTVPRFIQQTGEDLAFAHIDCDVYSSAAVVLETISERVREGTVLVFDDFFNFLGWRNHEFKAFEELVRREGIEYKYLAYGRHQVVLIVTKRGNVSLS